ncbi:hypothetical protein [Streptomyces sp. NPDC101132]|uniref:hypothetical protein n=1 Tax=Streptomyces sp. NPDC101132 TaxID=3366110 RepID=UPI00381FC77A
MRTRRWLVGLAALAASVAAGGCGGGGPGALPVTQEQAEQLSLVRLSTYEASPVGVRLRVPGPAGAVTVVEAVVDYRERRARGTYRLLAGAGGTAAAAEASRGALAWNGSTVSVGPAGASVRWSHRAYSRAPLDRMLLLVLQLGHDRPENAQLLAQSGTRWLGRRSLPGEGRFAVFAGPRPAGAGGAGSSPLTYWVDERGGLRRVEARVHGEGAVATVDFTGPAPSSAPSQAAGRG